MRNKYPGICFSCVSQVKKGEGFFQSIGSLPLVERRKVYGNGKWLLRCKKCVGSGNKVSSNFARDRLPPVDK